MVCNCRGSCSNDNFVMKGSSGDENFSKQPRHWLSDLCSEHMVIAGIGVFPKEKCSLCTPPIQPAAGSMIVTRMSPAVA